MITFREMNGLVNEIVVRFSDIRPDDAYKMAFDMIRFEKPTNKDELRKLAFQYAQRLANS